MQSVVITGVSAGLGQGIAQVLIRNGFHVFGSVRKVEDAERLSKEWGEAFTPLLFDVTDEQAVRQAANFVRNRLQGQLLSGLINNAGVALLLAPLIYQPVSEYRQQLEINLVGPLIVTQAFVDLLKADQQRGERPGRIINIGSRQGKLAQPFAGAYAASKFGLEGFSESLRRELLIHGIDVVVIGAGAIASRAWERLDQLDLSYYGNTEYSSAIEMFRRRVVPRPGQKGYSSEDLGNLVLHILTVSRPRVRYSLVSNPLRNWIIPRLLPKRVADAQIARHFGWRTSR
jgi:NAD(P)-dependent dehydrogenase (short-subunit alcohol dehydrogenase family)